MENKNDEKNNTDNIIEDIKNEEIPFSCIPKLEESNEDLSYK
jgi:hypothetical protein